jgi:hypothetical protein
MTTIAIDAPQSGRASQLSTSPSDIRAISPAMRFTSASLSTVRTARRNLAARDKKRHSMRICVHKLAHGHAQWPFREYLMVSTRGGLPWQVMIQSRRQI